jgi:hypothetical protein
MGRYEIQAMGSSRPTWAIRNVVASVRLPKEMRHRHATLQAAEICLPFVSTHADVGDLLRREGPEGRAYHLRRRATLPDAMNDFPPGMKIRTAA